MSLVFAFTVGQKSAKIVIRYVVVHNYAYMGKPYSSSSSTSGNRLCAKMANLFFVKIVQSKNAISSIKY